VTEPARERASTLQAAGRAAAELGERYPHFVVLTADSTQTMAMARFAELYPQRLFDFGIMEQCTVTAAAGLATCGFRPLVASYGVFLTMRALEQVRTFVALPNLGVILLSGNSGLSAGILGPTHQAVDDLAFMRAVPNMTVFTPADAVATAEALRVALEEVVGPSFIRVGGLAGTVHPADYRLHIGRATLLLDRGREASIIACGVMTALALDAAERLHAEGIGVRVLDIPTIKPLDTEAVCAEAELSGALVTAEEHSVIGGLGGAAAEALAATRPAPLERVGIADRYGETGSVAELMAEYGLTADAISAAVKRAIARRDTRA
jgi:transketolase